MPPDNKTFLYGSAVAVPTDDGGLRGVLIRGLSGTGKSDLALRLIARGARLISDDQVAADRRVEKVYLSAPDTIAGLLEVRGVGLLRFPPAPVTPLSLVVDLVPRQDVPRLPDWEKVDIVGVPFSRLKLHAFDVSSAEKIIQALRAIDNPALLAGEEKKRG